MLNAKTIKPLTIGLHFTFKETKALVMALIFNYIYIHMSWALLEGLLLVLLTF